MATPREPTSCNGFPQSSNHDPQRARQVAIPGKSVPLAVGMDFQTYAELLLAAHVAQRRRQALWVVK